MLWIVYYIWKLVNLYFATANNWRLLQGIGTQTKEYQQPSFVL